VFIRKEKTIERNGMTSEERWIPDTPCPISSLQSSLYIIILTAYMWPHRISNWAYSITISSNSLARFRFPLSCSKYLVTSFI